MRTPTIIAIGGAVALAVAWLLLARTPPPSPTRAPVPVTTPAVVAPGPPPQAPVIAKAEPPVAPPPAAAPQWEVPPPATVVQPPPASETQSEAPDETDATADEPGSRDDASDNDAGPHPIDADQAADHMADWIASQESESGDDQEKGDQVLQTFDGEATDPEWSEPTEKQIENVLNQWLDGLPAEIRAHIALITSNAARRCVRCSRPTTISNRRPSARRPGRNGSRRSGR